MSNYSILAIDQSAETLQLINSVLSQAGYEVVTAFNGSDGLQAAVKVHPDLVFLGYGLSDMNGFEFCQRLRNTTKSLFIPIVLLVSKGEIDTSKIVERFGIVDYILKPVSPDAISIVAAHVLTKYTHAKKLLYVETHKEEEEENQQKG